MNKYEQLIEYIINEDEDKAKALFHDIVVEKSRDIYESLMDEETVDETIGGNEVEDLVDEIQADETDGIPEGEEEEMDAEEEMMGGDDEEHADEEHGELEDKVMDLEKELDELKAEFDALMADEMEEPAHSDMADDMETDAEELEMYEGDKKEEEAVEEEKEEEVSEDAEEVAEDEEVVEDTEEVAESTKPQAKYSKSAVDLMREYVEKVAMPTGEDNKAVSPVASMNDMGGKAVDFDAGGDSNPDGAKAPAEGKVDSMPHAGKYQNVPGAKADLTSATGEVAKNTEEAGVNTKAVEGDK